MELQIFVSLVVVLGAAFVALICDFLKGSNERLREANLELQVRQDHLTARPSVAARAAAAPAAGVEQALARKVAVRRPVQPEPSLGAYGDLAGGRRRPPRTRTPDAGPNLEEWAKELVERQIPLPASGPLARPVAAMRVAAGPEPQAASAAAPALPGNREVPAPGEQAPVMAGLAGLKESPADMAPTLSAGVPAPVTAADATAAPRLAAGMEGSENLTREPGMAGLAPVAPAAPRTIASKVAQPALAAAGFLAETSLPSISFSADQLEPRAAQLAALPGGLPLAMKGSAPRSAVSALIADVAPAAPRLDAALQAGLPVAGASPLAPPMPARRPGFTPLAEAEPLRTGLEAPEMAGAPMAAGEVTPREAAAALPLATLPMPGHPAPGCPAAASGAAPLPFPSALAYPESGGVPAFEAAPFVQPVAAEAPAGAAPAGFEPAAPFTAEEEAAREQVPDAEEPIVRIRVLREEPPPAGLPEWQEQEPAAIQAELTQLQDLFEAPARTEAEPEPVPAGPVEEPVAALLAPIERPAAAVKPAALPSAGGPAIPRDNVIELPLNPLSVPAVRTLPVAATLDVPAGWHDVHTLQMLQADPLPFEGLVLMVSVTGYARLVQEYGAAKCEEAVHVLGIALANMAPGSDFLCRTAEDEVVILSPRLPASEHSSRVRLLAEVLWDYQLRTLSVVPVLCAWGAAEAAKEPLALALDRARNQMAESQRFRQGGSTILGRFRRRAVNG